MPQPASPPMPTAPPMTPAAPSGPGPHGPSRRRVLHGLGVALALGAARVQATDGAQASDETWNDARRQRALPLRIRWPDAQRHGGERPLVLFSHGLGGTVEGGAVWGEAWCDAGFVVGHLQHPGSDLPAVRAAASSFSDQVGLRAAAGARQLLDRLGDVAFVLDEVQRRRAAGQGEWARVRPVRVGLSGHSFGAHTTLGMAGQRYPGMEPIQDTRLAAFIALSPSLPALGDPVRAFAAIQRPLLAITGTRDQDVIGSGATPERRMQVFAALPAGGKAQLVLQDADHMSFAGQVGRATEIVPRAALSRERQPAHHTLVAAITTDWWRATLLDDAAARDRLRAPPGLAAGDRWEQK